MSMYKQPSCVWVEITENSKETTQHIKHTDLYSDSMTQWIWQRLKETWIRTNLQQYSYDGQVKKVHTGLNDTQAEHMKIEIFIEHSQCLMKQFTIPVIYVCVYVFLLQIDFKQNIEYNKCLQEIQKESKEEDSHTY